MILTRYKSDRVGIGSESNAFGMKMERERQYE